MSGRISVLMLVDHLHEGVGGAERFAVGLATALPADAFAVTVCTTRQARGTLPQALAAAGVRHIGLDRRRRADSVRFAGLWRELRARPPHVLHAHKFGSNVWGTLLGRTARVPVVVAHEQTWSYEGDPLRKVLDGALIGRLADAFVAVSSADAARMVRVERVPARKVRTIPNAYVASHRDPAPGWSLRAELGLPGEAELVGTAAMLRPQKAQAVLVDAFAAVAARHPAAHLVIAGEGECRPALEAQVARLGVADRVHLLGAREDVDAVLGELDVAVLSSDFEGTPLMAFECMAAGTPLVATSVGGLPDVVDDGRSGRLVPRRDPAALATAVSELLGDPAARGRLAAAAAARLDEFRMPAIAGRFAALYRELLEAKGAVA